MSRRRRGSPPVRMRKTLGLTVAISSITRRHSSVVSSPRVSAPATPEQRTVEFANGRRDVWPLGEVRIRLADSERTTVFLAGPAGGRPLLGAVTLEEFGVAVDPNHQRLVPISSFFV